MNIKLTVTILLISLSIKGLSTENDSTKNLKSGWSFGAVPVVAFDSDIGFKYGGLINFYHYGNGSIYPEYKHSIYLEWSHTTKGSGINQITYDSKYLIPGVRVLGEISYLTEQTLDFYGFNGYQALYNHEYEDESDTLSYISRVFYRQDRRMLRIRADFQGKLKVNNLSWIAGLTYYDVKLDTVDTKKINKGKSTDDMLPSVGGGLFGFYRDWNVVPTSEQNGGKSSLLKAGLIYDSRDNEPNPMKGIWTSFLFLLDPGIVGNHSAYAKFNLTHRQYFTIVPDRFSFVYRIAYQGRIFGETPSYMLPLVFSDNRFTDRDGLGGAKTIRGILRNRVVGEDIAYGNLEFRWKFLKTIIAKQNIYLALSAFSDMGMVTRKYKTNLNDINQEFIHLFPDENTGLHQSIGGGFRIALNENFIVCVDYGKALDKRDGNTGLYINMDWLF